MNDKKEWLRSWLIGTYFAMSTLNNIILCHYIDTGGHMFTSFHPAWSTPKFITHTPYIIIIGVWVFVAALTSSIGVIIFNREFRRGTAQLSTLRTIVFFAMIVLVCPVMYLLLSAPHHGLIGDYFLLGCSIAFSAAFGYVMSAPRKPHSESSDTDNT